MTWRSASCYSKRQSKAERNFAETCDLAMTNTRTRVDWLNRETGLTTAVTILYLQPFSQVGEAQSPVPLAERHAVMAVLGRGGTRRSAYREVYKPEGLLTDLGIRQTLDIGLDFEVLIEVGGILVLEVGVMSAGEAARELSRSTFYFLSHQHKRLVESGGLAGNCVHGVVPELGGGYVFHESASSINRSASSVNCLCV